MTQWTVVNGGLDDIYLDDMITFDLDDCVHLRIVCSVYGRFYPNTREGHGRKLLFDYSIVYGRFYPNTREGHGRKLLFDYSIPIADGWWRK